MKLKKTLILILFFYFFIYSTYLLLYKVPSEFSKRLNFYLTEEYLLFIRCKVIIPPDAKILLLSNESGSFGLFLSFHLFPRKVFLPKYFSSNSLNISDISELDIKWMRKKSIDWIIIRDSLRKLTKIILIDSNGDILKSISL